MASYRIEAGASKVVARARSSIHDTDTVWTEVSGTVEADRADLAAAVARFKVDMRSFDAGDWLKNRKLKKDLDADRYPEATFELTGLSNIRERDDGSFEATATGRLAWRGKEVAVEAKGTGTLTDDTLDAEATFELDVTSLGMKAPKILMFKIEDVVEIAVTLRGRS